MSQITFDGMTFGPDEIRSNRQKIIELRDTALKKNDFDYAVVLSHTVALLEVLAKQIAEPIKL